MCIHWIVAQEKKKKKQRLIKPIVWRGDIDTIINGDFNNPFSKTDKQLERKISRK